MTLDNLINTLDLAMHERVSEIDITKLKNPEVNLLNAFFIEKEKHPELISLIQIPELMHDYLSLSLEDRSKLEKLRINRPEYLEGIEDENHLLSINNEKVRSIAQKTRWTKQLIGFFDFYLKSHKKGEIFNQKYLKKNKQLKGKFGNLGVNLCNNTYRNLQNKGDIQKIVELALKERPEILKYWAYQKQTKFDLEQATQDIMKIFDFYLENREKGQLFNSRYLRDNKKLKKKFGNLGNNFCCNAYNNLRDEGGINKIIELAAQDRPEILEHWDYQNKKFDLNKAIQDFIRIFDFYLKNHKESKAFNSNYLMNNKKQKNKFGNLGKKLYINATIRHLRNEGCIQRIVELASQQRPEILDYWDYKKLNKFNLEQTVQDFIRIFDFYLKYHKEREVFNSKYFTGNKKLKKEFGNLGVNLYSKTHSNLKKQRGIQKIAKLASLKRPEILDYWDYKYKNKKFNVNQAIQDFIRIFDFYLEKNERDKVFNPNYLKINEKLKTKFGNLGRNLCSNAKRHLKKEGGVQKIVELAYLKRPELKQHTTFAGILKIEGPKQLIRMFDFYLKNYKKGEIFNLNYLTNNKKLKDKFGNLSVNLYNNAYRNLQNEGGIQKIAELASLQRPEILDYWSYKPKK